MRGRTPRFVLFGLLALAGLIAALLVWNRPRVPPRPDLILITVDTLRADHLGAYGYEKAKTPVLDRLAGGGTVFLQATTPFPRTTPGLASLLTGLLPQRHGSREVAQPIRKDVPTLAEILRDRGYATVGASANGAAGENQGMDRGFDHFLGYKELVPPVAKAVVQKTLEAASETPQEKPLFLWIHVIDPHFPYLPPPDFAAPEMAQGCRSLQAQLKGNTWRIGEVQRDRDGIATAVLEECTELYDAEIAYTDSEIGSLLEGLDSLGRLNDALIVFTADHGENLGEDGQFFEHGPSVHDASLRVPLIFSGSGIPERRDSRGARLEDVAPTLLSLLRVPRKEWPEMDGVDLSTRFRPLSLPAAAPGPATYAESGSALLPNVFNRVHSGRRRELHCLNAPRYSLCGKPGEPPGLFEPATDPNLEVDLSDRLPRERAALEGARKLWPPEQARQRALRTDRFKLVEIPLWRGGYQRALYDLLEDPEERKDVKHLFPDEFQELSRSLSAWTSSLPSDAPSQRTQEQLEAMRALGYVQ